MAPVSLVAVALTLCDQRADTETWFCLPCRLSAGRTSESGLLAFDICSPSLCTGRRGEREKLILRIAAFRAHADKYSKQLGKTTLYSPKPVFFTK